MVTRVREGLQRRSGILERMIYDLGKEVNCYGSPLWAAFMFICCGVSYTSDLMQASKGMWLGRIRESLANCTRVVSDVVVLKMISRTACGK